MALRLEVAARTDIGCVRQNNEDAFGCDRARGIYVVCDGMGGQAAGEIASRMAVDAVIQYFREPARSDDAQSRHWIHGVSPRAQSLNDAVQSANREIYQAAAGSPSRAGMGSTIVAVLVEDGSFSIAHAGDSRIYLLRAGSIEQLTCDHSLVMEQVRRGLLSREAAQNSEMQNIIIRALGPDQSVEVDVDDLEAQPGDILLLCTDGLTRHLSDETIRDTINAAASVEVACDRLIEAARAAGGSDNITCMLLKFVDAPWYRRVLHALSL